MAELAACYPVMRELRPKLLNEAEFIARVERQAGHGYRLLAAWSGERVIGLAGYRPQENLIYGRFIYVDDLVVAASERRGGIGALLLDGVSDECRRQNVPTLVLDTAIDNSLGQRFYFRYGMLARGLRFSKQVTP
jgi:GNAT superfamily N-acetyltransferase